MALNRRRSYAATHPMVQQAEVELHEALSAQLATAGPLSLGIAHRELLWNGTPVSSGPAKGGSVARELAERLHRRGVGALTFQPGVSVEDLRSALSWIAHEIAPGARGTPSENAPSPTPPTLAGVAIGRVAYDRLVLGSAEESEQLEISAIWRALASAAFDLELLESASDELAAQERWSGGQFDQPSDASSARVLTPLTADGQVEFRSGGQRGSSGGPGTGQRGRASGGAGLHGLRTDGAAAAIDGDSAKRDSANRESADGKSNDDGSTDDASAHVTDDLLSNASPDDIAAAIELRAQQAPYARRVAQVLLTLATQVGNAPPSVREELGQRLRTVLRKLGESSLASVLLAAGTGREQRQLLSEVISALPVQAVVEWLEVAARATNQELSHQLLRILGKLSRHATDRRGRDRQEVALRSAARDLVSSWRLSDPNPVAHSSLLDHIAQFDVTTLPGSVARRVKAAGDTVASQAADGGDQDLADVLSAEASPDHTDVEITAEHSIYGLATPLVDDALADALSAALADDGQIPGEGGRLVKMACEIGLASDDALSAAQQLVADGHAARLFAWLDASPNEQTGRALRESAISTRAVVAALQLEPFDAVAVRALVSALPVEAAAVLLDALESSNSRSARRVLYDRLREFGPVLVPQLLDRLHGTPPWYFARNLLALLRDASTPTEGSSASPRDSGSTGELARPSDLRQFLHHPAEQVRIEAVRILLDDESTRELATRQALADVNERIVRTGVDAVFSHSDTTAGGGTRGTISSAIVTRLMHLVDDAKYDVELRARALRALSGSPGPTVRDWLLDHVTRRTLVLRRTTLVDPNPIVIAALSVLAARHANDPRVKPLLALASRTHDERRTAVVEATPLGARA